MHICFVMYQMKRTVLVFINVNMDIDLLKAGWPDRPESLVNTGITYTYTYIDPLPNCVGSVSIYILRNEKNEQNFSLTLSLSRRPASPCPAPPYTRIRYAVHYV